MTLIKPQRKKDKNVCTWLHIPVESLVGPIIAMTGTAM